MISITKLRDQSFTYNIFKIVEFRGTREPLHVILGKEGGGSWKAWEVGKGKAESGIPMVGETARSGKINIDKLYNILK